MLEQTSATLLEPPSDKSTALFIHDKLSCQGMMKKQDNWTAMLQQPWTWLLYQLEFCLVQHTRKTPVDSPSSKNMLWDMIEQYFYFTSPVLSCWQCCCTSHWMGECNLAQFSNMTRSSDVIAHLLYFHDTANISILDVLCMYHKSLEKYRIGCNF